ncbi:hypothetical protein ACD591_16380 [Rufibacter glacialis]|uniref:Uncharacterized protein n=1 Tax=Rufibacter glacialis TaxID=1259555 RepID=A0A5M8QQG9_9BACT|nr:hypothetical protein [Rufibacter glacialis]KAA6437481.1 hypothetical protein FOE74_02980 [Rufibacter glacialis]GGK58999.1 hypothetical protein GCM10011405_03810 [Rufibacter glacialis]
MKIQSKDWFKKIWVQVLIIILVIGFVINVKQKTSSENSTELKARAEAGVLPSDLVLETDTSLTVDTTSTNLTQSIARAPSEPSYSTEQREELIKKQFSGWDGSHRQLVKMVKKSMNDPDSFEHEETSYLDKGDYLLVYMKFRGDNAYGAKVLNTVSAKADFNGNVIQVLE